MAAYDNSVEQIKLAGDAVAATVTAAAVLDAVPHITAFLTMIWVLFRLYETKLVQDVIAALRKKTPTGGNQPQP